MERILATDVTDTNPTNTETNPTNTETIIISTNTLSAHLAHGDTLGVCPSDVGETGTGDTGPPDPEAKFVLICHVSDRDLPQWFKTRATWWVAGEISDEEYISGMEYLLKS